MSSISTTELFRNIKLYRQDNYDFQISDNLKCLCCKQLLLNCMQTDCGCRYCKECIDDYQKDGTKTCLGTDCGEIESVYADQATNREIGKLKVKCLYEGCNHTDVLRDIDVHIKTCGFQTVVCKSCGERIIQSDSSNHLSNILRMRQVKCSKYGDSMTYDKLNEIHLKVNTEELCPQFEALCPYMCGIKGDVNVKIHRKECPKNPIVCPYSEIGCIEIVTEESKNQHMNSKAYAHSELLLQNVEVFKVNVAVLSKDNEQLKQDVAILQNELNRTKHDCDSKIREMQKSVKSSSPPAALPAAPALNILQNRDDRIVFRNGVYIWKIEHFSEIKRSAERGKNISVGSEPFYTKDFGYKMSMKIYPAGDGVGKNTHLSVFFTLMKGDYDDLLPWPFKNKVTLTILDQVSKKTNHHSGTLEPDIRSTAFQQPMDEYNIGYGVVKFIAFPQLYNRYIKNDTIFLKIQVLL